MISLIINQFIIYFSSSVHPPSYICIFLHFYYILISITLLIDHFRKRKLTTAIRHEWLMTGGGPAPVQPNDPVIAFMVATNANIDIEINCAFDSTAVYEKECKYYTYTVLIFHLYYDNHF